MSTLIFKLAQYIAFIQFAKQLYKKLNALYLKTTFPVNLTYMEISSRETQPSNFPSVHRKGWQFSHCSDPFVSNAYSLAGMYV